MTDPASMAVFIGGPAASGKTTIARTLAQRRGLRWYSTDAHSWSFRDRAVAAGLHDPDDPSPGDFDRAPMIMDDLAELAATEPSAGVIVEGALIEPGMSKIITDVTSRAVWLMPSAEEQLRRLTARSGRTDGHDGVRYGHRLITGQLQHTDAMIIAVDGQTVEQTISAVEQRLGPLLDGLPFASTAADRDVVRRFGEDVLAAQRARSRASGMISPGPE